MKFIRLIVSLAILPIFAIGQPEIHAWTNKKGQTIRAKFVQGNGETITIFLNGRNYVYKLTDLDDESQALARKLSQPSASVQDEGKDSYSEAEIKRVVDEHNRLRREVGVRELKWDSRLAQHAQIWADTMAREQSFEHSKGRNNEGENIAYAKGYNRSKCIEIALEGWGEEEKVIYRSRGEPVIGKNTKGVGHYTQMVWTGTTRVGVATTKAKDGKYYTCARYSPAGNILGKHPYAKSK